MSKLKPNHFLETISYLRQEEHLIIHDNILNTTKNEDNDVLLFLEQEYDNESLGYPFSPPEFNPSAALWASKIFYYAALLLLHRNNTKKDLNHLLPSFKNQITDSAILSADLSLRFLPKINLELQRIDADDPLIPILENILNTWHYSAIDNNSKPPEINFQNYFKNECTTQLYLDRIIEKKAIAWAETPTINTILNSNLGYYKAHFWSTLKTIDTETNE